MYPSFLLLSLDVTAGKYQSNSTNRAYIMYHCHPAIRSSNFTLVCALLVVTYLILSFSKLAYVDQYNHRWWFWIPETFHSIVDLHTLIVVLAHNFKCFAIQVAILVRIRSFHCRYITRHRQYSDKSSNLELPVLYPNHGLSGQPCSVCFCCVSPGIHCVALALSKQPINFKMCLPRTFPPIFAINLS